jgi:hypothetical protein
MIAGFERRLIMYLPEIKRYERKDILNGEVQFITISSYLDRPFSYCCNIKDLISDWYGDCNNCPENGEMLLQATLYMNGKAYPIEGVGLNEDITFETLMQALDV